MSHGFTVAQKWPVLCSGQRAGPVLETCLRLHWNLYEQKLANTVIVGRAKGCRCTLLLDGSRSPAVWLNIPRWSHMATKPTKPPIRMWDRKQGARNRPSFVAAAHTAHVCEKRYRLNQGQGPCNGSNKKDTLSIRTPTPQRKGTC